ncbi:AraC family transcriptional regulator [Cohnella fermenti]|uniref:Helix-turn-helix domain-containing protein n=1 Tax=Cohnella fermenti TaxID=2565925 RepID=A0A4S4BKN2_9BACL|nr:AraC family transcriptional regulator [Cohnella fermenti]THF72705.1 helix-turn-helix domain-containing protein [Cohnella fermenti]
MALREHIQLWNQVMVRVLDVRHIRVERGDELYRYLTPASAFLFAAHGQGELWVEDDVRLIERFYLLHTGKGRRVTVRTDGFVELYLILYKATLPASSLREFHMAMQSDNPFQETWGLVPSEPLELLELARTMQGDWRQAGDGVDRLRIKGDFIRFVYTILKMRTERDSLPSLSEQVVRYLARHYRQPISLEQLAQQLSYSAQYIAKKFKEQTGRSPMEYIIALRMEGARELLIRTSATLQEVASHVGYPDLMYFSRVFKKNVGMTPGEYRKRYGTEVSNNPMNRTDLSIVLPHPVGYHLNGNEIHSQYIQDGESSMSTYKGKVSAMILLGLTMILSACGASNNNGSAGGQASGSIPAASGPQAETAAATETRTITTAYGDVEIPAHPQRVAAISYLGTVLALDVTPIASETFLMNSPYLAGKLDGIVDVGDSMEMLLETAPDLILTISPKPEVLEQYNKIAPTISIPYNSFPSIQEEMRYFGDILDKKDEAEAWIADFDQRVAGLRDQVQAAVAPGETISVMQEYDGTVFLFGPKSGRGGRILYEILGLDHPAAIPQEMLTDSYAEFSLEKLTDYTGDYLVLTTEASLADLQADPLWGNLPAIKNNRTYLWTENQSWYRDPIAVDGQIQGLADWLLQVAGK